MDETAILTEVTILEPRVLQLTFQGIFFVILSLLGHVIVGRFDEIPKARLG